MYRIACAFALVCVVCACRAGEADAYPTRPVRIIVGLGAGGPTDMVARALASKLTESLGQQVVVDNRPGAGGTIAGELVARSKPDGHTVYVVGISIAIRKALAKNLSFDPVNDVTPVSLLTTTPNVVVSHPSVPVKSARDLIQLAKRQPGKLTYGSGGVGQSPHLSMELFKRLAAIDLTHVPYKTSVIGTADVISGQIDLYIGALPGLIQYIKAGKVRALGVTSARRSAQLPELPSIQEQGVPGYDVTAWLGLFGPPRLPAPITTILNTHTVRAFGDPAVRSRLLDIGSEVSTSSSEVLGALLKQEEKRWAQVIKEARVQAE